MWPYRLRNLLFSVEKKPTENNHGGNRAKLVAVKAGLLFFGAKSQLKWVGSTAAKAHGLPRSPKKPREFCRLVNELFFKNVHQTRICSPLVKSARISRSSCYQRNGRICGNLLAFQVSPNFT
jgi:hypothetical protein